MKKASKWCLGMMLGLLAGAGVARAAVPPSLNVQGVLRNAQGQLQTSTLTLDVAFYSSAMQAAPITTVRVPNVESRSGVFSVDVPISDSSVFAAPAWLEVTVVGGAANGTDEVLPRFALGTVPYAFYADEAAHAATAGDATTVGGTQLSGLLRTSQVAAPLGISAGNLSLASTGCADGGVWQWDATGMAWVCRPMTDVRTPMASGLAVTTNANNRVTISIEDGAITSARVLDGTLEDADISPTAAIAFGKLSGVAAAMHSHADGDLSSNVALLDASQTFTGDNTFTGAIGGMETVTLAKDLFINGTGPSLTVANGAVVGSLETPLINASATSASLVIANADDTGITLSAHKTDYVMSSAAFTLGNAGNAANLIVSGTTNLAGALTVPSISGVAGTNLAISSPDQSVHIQAGGGTPLKVQNNQVVFGTAVAPLNLVAPGNIQAGIANATTGTLQMFSSGTNFVTGLEASANAQEAATYVLPARSGVVGSVLTTKTALTGGKSTLEWKVPAITNQEISNQTAITTNSTTLVDMTNTTLSLAPGKYLVMFSGTVSNTNAGKSVTVQLLSGATAVVATQRTFVSATAAATSSIQFQTILDLSAAVANTDIKVQWKVSANTGTVNERTLTAIQL